MNPNPNNPAPVTAAALVELRQHPDAVRLISEKLQVKSMGPADHIRTKHEIKAFVGSANDSEAAKLLQRAEERRALGEKLDQSPRQIRSQRLSQ